MDYRLPTTVVPSRYDIRLEPDLEAATFAGEESIAITVAEAVSEIVLNAAELTVQRASVQLADGAVVQGSATLEVEDERVRLLFPSPIPAGEHRLTIAFTLSHAEPAKLEVLDLAGRRVAAQDLSAAGAGRHVIAVTPQRALDPGVYLVRLSGAEGSRTAKVSVMR